MSGQMPRDSVEYLEFTITERDQKDISGDPVQVSLTPRGSRPTTWLPCTYVGPTTDAKGKPATRWRTTSEITWSTANYPLTSYRVFVKVTDSPEIPYLDLGTLYVS